MINDTLSGDARLPNFKISSHGVKSKYLGFLGLFLQLLLFVFTQNTNTFSHSGCLLGSWTYQAALSSNDVLYLKCSYDEKP